MKLIKQLKEGVAEKPALINWYCHKGYRYDEERKMVKYRDYHLVIKIPNRKYLKLNTGDK